MGFLYRLEWRASKSHDNCGNVHTYNFSTGLYIDWYDIILHGTEKIEKHNRDYNKGKLENLSLKDQTELEVYDICYNAKGMSVSKIVRYLKEQKVHNGVISKSLDLLPDKKPLMNLFVDTKLSPVTRRYMELSNKGINELYLVAHGLIKNNSNEGLLNDEDIEAVLDKENPKESLIELIIANELYDAVGNDEEHANKKDI